MRTYYCECGEKTEVQGGMSKECKCGKGFGYNFKTSNHINMRTTWSGQTKVEFNETTMDESIKKMNKGN